MLGEEQKLRLKEALEKERVVLEEELGKLGKRNPSNPSDWVAAKLEGEEFGADRTDNAGVIEEIQGNYAALSELEGRLNSVLHALEKFDKGTYGMCEVGNTEIEFARLEANPAARTCKVHMSEESKLST